MTYFVSNEIQAFAAEEKGEIMVRLKGYGHCLKISLKDWETIVSDSYIIKQYMKKSDHRQNCHFLNEIDACLCGKNHVNWDIVDQRLKTYPSLLNSISILFRGKHLIFSDKNSSNYLIISYYGFSNLVASAYEINKDICKIKGKIQEMEEKCENSSSDDEDEEELWLEKKLELLFEYGQYNDDDGATRLKSKIKSEYERKNFVLRKVKDVFEGKTE